MELFRQVYIFLPNHLQRRFWLLLAAMLGLAVVETVAVGIIAFYAATISDPQAAYQSVLDFHFLNIRPAAFIEIFNVKVLIALLSVLLMVAVLIKNIFSGVVTLNISKFSATIESYIGSLLLESFLYQSYQWHLTKNSADLVQFVNWRIFLGRNFMTPTLRVLTEISMLIVLIAGLLIVQPIVSLLFISFQSGAGFLVYRYLRKGLDVNARGCREVEQFLNRNATMSLHAVKDVQISGTQPYFLGVFKTSAQTFANLFGRQQFWRESPLLALETIGFVLIATTILFMLFVLGYSPLETTGTTALLAVTAWRTLPAFNRVLSSLATIRSSVPYSEQILAQIAKMNTAEKGIGPNVLNSEELNFTNEVEFRDVSFSYTDGRDVVQSLSFKIIKGSFVGIMGASGCGKSTLVDMLSGLLIPQKGQILIDGQSLSRNRIPLWQKKIGYVPQFPYIFDGTLVENVAFGVPLPQIDRELVFQVLEMAAVDFLPQLPDGIDSLIGERGVRLSGGQRQRIAIARALYRNPQLLIFDEATSALDDKNDFEIMKLVNAISKKMTIVQISHRSSSLSSCDYILRIS